MGAESPRATERFTTSTSAGAGLSGAGVPEDRALGLDPGELEELETAVIAELERLVAAEDAEGVLRWSGRMVRGELIVIEEDRAIPGRIEGMPLPGLPVRLRVPGDLVEIVELPGATSLWTRVVLRALADRPDGAAIDIHWTVGE